MVKQQRKEVIITGFGGQGIVLAGKILGMAAVLGDKRQSTLVQSYGPESRGGACCAQVIISDDTIQYPYITCPDILVCMSQSAFEKYQAQLKPEGVLLTDRDLVIMDEQKDHFSIPATRIADDLGRKMMANIIMIGFTIAITGLISSNAVRESIKSSVPPGTDKLNLKAFSKGFDYGMAKLKGRRKKASGRSGVLI